MGLADDLPVHLEPMRRFWHQRVRKRVLSKGIVKDFEFRRPRLIALRPEPPLFIAGDV
jgi:hypothetical protein